MIHKFKDFIAKENLFEPNQKVLLAVSGGLDSVAMTYLFKEAGFNFGIAHCNFNLRGQDSIDDEIFVKKLSKKLEVAYFSKSFDTEKIASKNKQSIQIIARELRYTWFDKILKSTDYQCVATAHHLNDSIETVLYNFTKGSGIRGLHGILSKNGNIIRPLLFATRVEIENYAKAANIPYQTDASNASDKYSRNRIRHHVIPILQSINPSFEKTVSENIERLKETEAIFDTAIERIRKEVLTEKGGLVFINFKALPEKGKSTILFELLKNYGFNNDQCKQILFDDHAQSGSSFYSNSHRLVIDRSSYIIDKIEIKNSKEYLVEKETQSINIKNKTLFFNQLNSKPNTFSTDKNIAIFDLEKLKFPLLLRKWKAGDIFQPLGMNGKKQKLKDFFTHNKLSIPEKEKIWILESDGKICWIVGYRIDERFKLTDQTQKCYKIEIKTR